MLLWRQKPRPHYCPSDALATVAAPLSSQHGLTCERTEHSPHEGETGPRRDLIRDTAPGGQDQMRSCCPSELTDELPTLNRWKRDPLRQLVRGRGNVQGVNLVKWQT